jgi:hypothetical protein
VILVELLSKHDQQEVSFDRGLWSWLAAYYFEQLAPRDESGKRMLRKDYVYALSESRIYYRHLVRSYRRILVTSEVRRQRLELAI